MRGVIALSLFILLGPGATTLPPLSHALAGSQVLYDVVEADTLSGLAAQFGVDARTIAARNGLKPAAALRPGQRLTIDAVHIVPETDADNVLVINIPQRLLFVDMGEYIEAIPVAVGRPAWRTPVGSFTVLTREEHPTWDVPISIQHEMERLGKAPLQHVPPSPANPLGDYWIGLSLPGLGIHGTNAPRSIYGAVTHGCIRVHPSRIEGVFNAVSEGTKGMILYQPFLVAVVGPSVFVEIHADVYRRAAAPLDVLHGVAARDVLTERIDWTIAEAAIRAREGIAVDVSRRNPAGITDSR